MIELTFDEGVSLNQWYSGKHWSFRKKLKDRWRLLVLSQLGKKRIQLKEYRVEMEYNSRLDPSNTITVIKLVEDVLKEEGIIIDDNKKYCKEIIIKPCLTLPKNTYVVRIY